MSQKWPKFYTFSAIASKQSANNQKTHDETTWDEKNSVSAIQPNWLDTVGPTVQKIQHFKVGKSAKISHFFIFFVNKIKKLAQFHHFYSQQLSLIQFVTCPVSYQLSTLGHFDQGYLKIKKKWAKNGQKFTPLQQLQANSLQITKKHMMKLPGMKKTVFQHFNPTGWTLSAQRFRSYGILKFGSPPKTLLQLCFFAKKMVKTALILHFGN